MTRSNKLLPSISLFSLVKVSIRRCRRCRLIGCGKTRRSAEGPRQGAGGGNPEQELGGRAKMAPMPHALNKPPLTKEDDKHNTEAYDPIVENGFLAADPNPLSTLSIDVDTASYSNVRRFLLNEGRLPPPDAVRIEELINYFPYRYPLPKGDHPVAFTLDLADCPWNAKHYLVRIGLMAERIESHQDSPRNFVS